MRRIISVLLLASLIVAQQVDRSAHQVSQLPGWTQTSFNMYSGLLNVSSTHRMHYMFLESQNKPASDPVILWLNGGPGCSSMLGLFQEVGPYLMQGKNDYFDSTVNPNSLQLKNNMIFLESPVAVGFSEDKDPNRQWNDNSTALDSYTFLREFFDVYPEYRENDFYIAGESYAGIYIPKLAHTIIRKNQAVEQADKINLKGIMVGNGAFSGVGDYLVEQMIVFMSKRQLITQQMESDYLYFCSQPEWAEEDSCKQLNYMVSKIISNINIYNVYGRCEHDYEYDLYSQYHYFIKAITHPVHKLFNQQEIRPQETKKDQIPCQYTRNINDYMNRADVKKALNVDQTIEWKECNMEINQKYNRIENVYSTYQLIFENNIRVLVYSGDVDMAVSTISTLEAFEELNIDMDVVEDWRPWINTNTSQTAGFVTKYKQLTFSTIKGAGHMVPSDKPQEFAMMIDAYLQQKDLPQQPDQIQFSVRRPMVRSTN